MRKIIVNADDFGQTISCTQAISDALLRGYITDTTMVANGHAFDLALELISKNHLENRIGIHFVITEDAPLSDEMKNCRRFVTDGVFNGRIRGKARKDKLEQFRPLTRDEQNAVYIEWKAQIDKLISAGIRISHADSHHHAHTKPALAPIFAQLCHEYGIIRTRPFLNVNPNAALYNKLRAKKYNKWLIDQRFKTVDFFCSAEEAQTLLPKDRIIEIMTHPDYSESHTIIERVSIDDYPVGKELKELASIWQTGEMISYRDL